MSSPLGMDGWRRGRLATSILLLAVACSSSNAVGPGTPPEQEGGVPDDVASGEPESSPPDAGPVETVLFDKTRIGSRNGTGWPNVGRASTDLVLGDGPYAKVTLVIDLDTTCYPFEKWMADPPPPGQNWPPSCDAFDRNFNVWLDDPGPSDAGGRPPGIEVAHAITPFGGPEHLEVDVTDLANGLPGKHELAVDIAAYSDPAGKVTGSNNGWTVSAKLLATLGAAPHKVLAVVPLYAGVQSSGDTPPMIPFDVPAGTTAARIEYRTSGHGGGEVGLGCMGPAEEFCNHPHQVLVDGTVAKMVRTWRTDCATLCTITHGPRFDYCLENPCGDMSSVDAPRANWCPGSMTPPFVWDDIPALVAPGAHTFGFSIVPILPGGNWQVSAIYFAFGSI